MFDTPSLPGGWLRLDGGPMLDQYWFDPFPLADESTPPHQRYGPEDRTSPVHDQVSEIQGATVQWLNVTTGAAIIMRLNGGWSTLDGGDWHVWWSPGEGRLPVELTRWLTNLELHRVRGGENAAWIDRRRAAIKVVERDVLHAVEKAP